MVHDPTQCSALELSAAIRSRELSCREVMQAFLARLDRLNPQLNAVVNRLPDDMLLAQADARDAELARGRWLGWLHGLPLAIKDTAQAAGLPTTLGSPLLRDAVAREDSLYVARVKAAGALVIGKTNMPELGLGSHTVNPLFGATPNAWNPALSAGGSSGGAAVALAHRMLPVADGSDFMGSLRNPAGWNQVFGLRPSTGLVPGWPKADQWLAPIATDGPMARHMADLAAMLHTQSGPDARVPLSSGGPTPLAVAPAPLRGLRIGWLGDLGGHLAVEPGILAACEHALRRLEAAGAQVEPLRPGFDPEAVWRAWCIWRHLQVAPGVQALVDATGERDAIKAEALWELDRCRGLDALAVAEAGQVRTRFHAEWLRLFEAADLLALPVSQVWPFALEERWPRSIAGRAMDTYHRWMECTLYASFAGSPALSVPAAFDAGRGVPMGLQWIAPPGADATLLALGAAYEPLVADLLAMRPADPAGQDPGGVRAAHGIR